MFACARGVCFLVVEQQGGHYYSTVPVCNACVSMNYCFKYISKRGNGPNSVSMNYCFLQKCSMRWALALVCSRVELWKTNQKIKILRRFESYKGFQSAAAFTGCHMRLSMLLLSSPEIDRSNPALLRTYSPKLALELPGIWIHMTHLKLLLCQWCPPCCPSSFPIA